VTTVIARWTPTDKAANLDPLVPANAMWFPFDPNGGHGYVWHCHIIDHEDNEMMRPYNVTLNPARAGADKGVIYEAAAIANVSETFALNQNYPNPFNPTTQITFQLPEASNVRLAIYNTLGQEVRTLVNSAFDKGPHSVTWDASDNFGNRVASGIYIYRIESGSYVQQKKMMLLK
jgi:FlgD Ig-like domain